MRNVTSLGWIVMVGITAGAAAGSDQKPYFTGIGDLPGGAFGSFAHGVSGDGRVVLGIGSLGSLGIDTPVYWTFEGGMVRLEPSNGLVGGGPQSASYDGSIIVGSAARPNGPSAAFRWTRETGMVDLGELPGGQLGSGAFACSADGLTIVGIGYSAASGAATEGVVWTPESEMIPVGDLPGSNYFSALVAVSADGSIAVGRTNSTMVPEAVYWTRESGLVGLGDLPGGLDYSEAKAISADGRVIVGRASDGVGFYLTAFIWTQKTGMRPLKDLSGQMQQIIPYGISANGRVVVGGAIQPGDDAFVWDVQNGFRNLHQVLEQEYGLPVAGWNLVRATGISYDGRTIVGNGFNPHGESEGWVAYLGPSPPCVGDLNGDTEVGLADVARGISNFGMTEGATPADGDLDNDGDIDLNDLSILLDAFGTLCL